MKHAARQPLLAATAAAAVIATGLIGPASPALAANPTSEQSTTQGFRKAITVPGIQEHLRAFQAHSDTGGGNRVAGSVGFEKSVEYVAARARAAGLQVSFDDFTFPYNADRTPPTFRQGATSYVDGVDFSSMTFSENLPTTTAPVYAVDLVLPRAASAGATTSGCQPADFSGFPVGAIALVQRGGCTFAAKAANAEAAGAVATIVFNDGGDAGRVVAVAGTSSANSGAVLGTSLAIGQDLANGVTTGATGSTATLRIDRVQETRTTRNVIAETPTGDPNQVVVVGAHLDSVPRGAGINDNGSGSAGILEIAEQLAVRGFDNRNKVRFIWWSAEEFGLLGSRAYVAELPQAERDRIALNLNFDMIGSPNYARFVYDGDNSTFPAQPNGTADGPAGSGEIERVFTDYFKAAGLASGETPFSGRSDYGPFIAPGVDIPAGGLFTGAEGLKTAAEVGFFGGTAGVAYDACYHLACDTITNINLQGLDEMSDAAAHATLHFAKRNFVKQPLVDPTSPVTGIATTPSGGGLHEDDHDHEGDVG